MIRSARISTPILMREQYPLVKRVLFHITGRCNLSCEHCYTAAFAEEQGDAGVRSAALRVAREFDVPLDITGGEPFVTGATWRLLGEAAACGVEISSIFTNGTVLDANRLRRHRDLVRSTTFYVSLDGYLGSHDVFRGRQSFSRALESVARICELGLPVAVNTMLHAGFGPEDLRRLYECIRWAGVRRWRVDTPFNAGRWRSNKAVRALSLADAFEAYRMILRWSLDDELPLELELDHALKYISGRFVYLDAFNLDSPVCPCRTLTIWPDGSVTWCQDLHRESDVIGRVGEDPAVLYARYAPFKMRTISDLLAASPTLGGCLDCRSLRSCGLGCRANAVLDCGDELARDPEICELHESGHHRHLGAELRAYAERRRPTGHAS